MKRQFFFKKFIEKAKTVHGGKYDYSKVEYVDSTTPVCIICPIHGEFWQTPVVHAKGSGCPKCANKKRGDTFRWTTEKFIEEAHKVHGEKYDYSHVKFENTNTNVRIICPEHGEFMQKPNNHLQGQGCPKCSHRGLSKEEIISEFREVHGDKYQYDIETIGKMNDKCRMICPEHGEFWQSPTKHLRGQGCPKCGIERRTEIGKITLEDFIRKANEVHESKYNYKLVQFSNVHEKTDIICPKHGVFSQNVYDHMNGHGCPKCGMTVSNGEIEIRDFIASLIGDENIEIRNRNILNGKEIDIYIKPLKLGIEYNGVIWHSEKFRKNKNYHLNKTEEANKKGVKLIQIFEDEYNERKDIVLSKIKYMISKSDIPKVYGRKCKIEKITKKLAYEFLEKNHIQGFAPSSVYMGAFYEDRLVSVITFKKVKEEWELTRFASDINLSVIGTFGKLLKMFIGEYNPETIKTFSDIRWCLDKENNIYTKNGFILADTIKPNYTYTSETKGERIHKFNMRKNILHKKYGLSLSMTEKEMCDRLGFYKVWDCGLYKYIWKKK